MLVTPKILLKVNQQQIMLPMRQLWRILVTILVVHLLRLQQSLEQQVIGCIILVLGMVLLWVEYHYHQPVHTHFPHILGTLEVRLIIMVVRSIQVVLESVTPQRTIVNRLPVSGLEFLILKIVRELMVPFI